MFRALLVVLAAFAPFACSAADSSVSDEEQCKASGGSWETRGIGLYGFIEGPASCVHKSDAAND